ncbi:hypothetical protein ACS0TY_031308 [Phlomoides rotata]
MNRVRKTSMGLSSLLIDNEPNFNTSEIAAHAVQYYLEIFSASESGLNSSLVTLIPNKIGANKVEDFRPIVTGNYLFKIFTKIVVTRLGDVINILDNPTRIGNMTIKIDMHKAFDTVSWRFLQLMLQKLNFSSAFQNLITVVLHSTILSILINSSPASYFACSKGVRQEDPLFPLLFCIVEKALCSWIDRKVNSGRLSQISRAPRYLLYADDIMIFVKATTSNIRCIQSLLEDYENLSGHLPRLVEGTRWVIGQNSRVTFWNDNWLGYNIVDRIGIPPDFAIQLKSCTSDYYFDEMAF